MSLNEAFNWSFYDMLLLEDRKMIDEYIHRMSAADINSFMQRLIEYYKIEEALEVNEEEDITLVFERNKILSKYGIKSKEHIKTIPYIHLFNFFEEYFHKNKKTYQCLYPSVYKYLQEQFLHDTNAEINIREFIQNKQLQRQYKNIGWAPDKHACTKIHEFFIEIECKNNNKYIKTSKNILAPLHLYTYRLSKKNIVQSRLGLALNKKLLQNKTGYGQNFKTNIKCIKVYNADSNFSTFIKSANYWMPKNALQHGFDKKTCIIWFEGNITPEKYWTLPNGYVVKNDQCVKVDFVYTTDAFSKMFQRFDFNGKIKRLISQLESNHVI